MREDILKASAYTASPEAVDHLIHRGPELIENLLLEELDVAFDRDDAGNLKLTREGGHSKPRIIYAKDRTGHAILDRMTERLRNVPKVELLPHRRAVDLLTFSHHSIDLRDKYRELTCFGAYVLNKGTGEVETIKAKKTILATGGLGQIFERTTNQPGSVGSGIAMAYRMGARIMDVEYIQFHPTVLHKKGCPPLLISEAVRGEGGVLVNQQGEAFMDRKHPQGSLAPRDIISREIHKELYDNDTACVFIDLSKLAPDTIRKRFPNIYQRCKDYGVDITEEPIPVSPAAHYLCGGVFADLRGRTTIRHLNAIGETGCTGLHGANRLASTSLLECLVSAFDTARADAEEISSATFRHPEVSTWQSGQGRADPVLLEQDLRLIQKTLWNYGGILRSRKRLDRAKKVLWEIKEAVDETYRTNRLTDRLLELRDAAQTGLLVVYAALRNPQSAGCHFIVDD